MNLKTTFLILINLSNIFFFHELKQKEESLLIRQTDILPKQAGLLNDFEGDFTTKQKGELQKMISNFQKTTHKNIVIASVKAFSPYDDFEEFTVDLGNKWKLKNTVFIVFSKNKRKIALSIAKDVTGLSDTNGKNIVSQIIIPQFKKDNYYDGIKNGTETFILRWK